MGKIKYCLCVKPDEQPDSRCGNCNGKRIGDDLTAEQFTELEHTLAVVLFEESAKRQYLYTVHNRKRRGRGKYHLKD